MITYIFQPLNEQWLEHRVLKMDIQLLRKCIHRHVPTAKWMRASWLVRLIKSAYNKWITWIFGISKRPLTSLEPGGSGRPPGRVHLTRERIGPSSRHWNTTSKPVFSLECGELQKKKWISNISDERVLITPFHAMCLCNSTEKVGEFELCFEFIFVKCLLNTKA